ncbi:MAG: hypothetical protein ACFFHV_10010 [Promethearchaeota archaeon]
MRHSDADQFFDEVKLKIKRGIVKKDIDLEKLVKEIVSFNVNFLTEFQRLTKKIQAVNDYDLIDLYGDIFKVILRYLKNYREDNNIKEISITNDFVENFIDEIVDILVIEKLCFNCKSPNIYKSKSPFDETRTLYFCRHCQKSVKVFQNIKYLPIFLIYLNKWMLDFNIRDLNKNLPKIKNYNEDFVFYLFSDCLDFFKDKGSSDTLLMLYEILIKNDINHIIINDSRKFQTVLIENLKESLNRQDFYDFFIGKNYYNSKYGEIPQDIKFMIVDSIVKSLKTGEISKIKYAIENLNEDEFFTTLDLSSNNKIKQKIEKNFYLGLGNCLRSKNFENFEIMVDSSIDFDIFIDVRKIPNRFEIISALVLDCVREVSEGYQTSSLGKEIDILRFCNDYNLFERDLKEEELKIIENLKRDILLTSNLHDLFGEISNCFLLFIRKTIPQDLYQFFIGEQYLYYTDQDQLAFYIKNVFFNQYSIYGLSVRYLSSAKNFIKEFKKYFLKNESNLANDFMEFPISYQYQVYFYLEYERDPYTIVKKHLVAPKVIFKNIDNILAKNNYKFYSLSMVLLGGLGPQGHGFTYSTPKGEVIEICSDARENEAIIVKYKQFLRQQFLTRLEKELRDFHVNIEVINKITNYLLEILDQNELINYYKKGRILRKIKEFLYQNTHQDEIKKINIDFKNLIDDITNAINNILREIKMEDQFKTRMDLILKNEMKSEDIAKMTSLRQKSHYDVLRERFFFQYIVDWFYEVYSTNKSNRKKLP